MADRDKMTIYCSFCGKSEHEVRKIIPGPNVFICNECTELCQDICDEDRAQLGSAGLTEVESLRLENRNLRTLAEQALEWCNREVLAQQKVLAPLVKITEGLRTALRPPERPASERGVVATYPKPEGK